jgi:hypothetical protein
VQVFQDNDRRAFRGSALERTGHCVEQLGLRRVRHRGRSAAHLREHLEERAQRLLGKLAARARRNERGVAIEALEKLANQTRFSDTRLPADEHETAVSVARGPAPRR